MVVTTWSVHGVDGGFSCSGAKMVVTGAWQQGDDKGGGRDDRGGCRLRVAADGDGGGRKSRRKRWEAS
nr:hypothetical protein [Tanacetum cinerariifolium]